MNENQAPAVRQRDVRDLLRSETIMEQCRLALPQHLTPERMVRVMCTSMLRNPKLLDCRQESLVEALMICSQAGIEPDGRNAHLIPYGDKVQVIFDYKGLVAIAERNGVESIYADKVCENDTFDCFVEEGLKKLKHRVDWRKPRGNAYAYYASCIRSGRLDYEVMTKDEVDAIRKRSKASGSGPWITDYDEMAKKTVLRRMSKRWDLSPEVRDAMTGDSDVPDFENPPIVAKAPKFIGMGMVQPETDAAATAPEPPKKRRTEKVTHAPATEVKAEVVKPENVTPMPETVTPQPEPPKAVTPASDPADDLFDEGETKTPTQLDELLRLMSEKDITPYSMLGFCGEKKLFKAEAQPPYGMKDIKEEKLVTLCQHVGSGSKTCEAIKNWKPAAAQPAS